MQITPHAFRSEDFVGGHVALDFANTVTARDTSPRDWLDGYGRLIEWARLGGLLDAAGSARLTASAERAPREAAGALGRARKLREALHDTLVALLGRRAVSAATLTDIETAWKRA